MTPTVGAAIGAGVVGVLTYLVEGEAGPAVIGAAVGGLAGYFGAEKFFPDDFIAHAASGNNPAYAEYSPAGAAKARQRLAVLTIAGGGGLQTLSGQGATLSLSMPLTQGLPDANTQLSALLAGVGVGNVLPAMNAWLESVAYSSIVISPVGIVLPAPFALLTDSKRGWK